MRRPRRPATAYTPAARGRPPGAVASGSLSRSGQERNRGVADRRRGVGPLRGAPVEAGNGGVVSKQILRTALELRPAGIRRRLAEVLGKNRSFITHLSNPVYSTPIPAQYVETILSVCHFSVVEREAFLAAYERAHPGRLARPSAQTAWRRVELRLPDLNDPERNAHLDRLLQDMGLRMAHLMQTEKEDGTQDG